MLSITTLPPLPENEALSLSSDEFSRLSVVDQLRRAFSPGHRLGASIGMAIGGFVPIAAFEIVHFETVANKWLWLLVAGGLLFSGLSVFRWATAAFASSWKGIGFVVLCEGAMVASHCRWLALSALAILVLINVASASCALQVRTDGAVTPETGLQTLGLTPTVTVNVQALQQNTVTERGRSSRGKSDAQRKADAERSRRYRARQRDAAASQTQAN